MLQPVLIFQPLLRSVPADILPSEWGGTKKGEGFEGICVGGEVTEEYLQQAKPEEIPGEDDLEIVDYQVDIKGMGEIFQTKIEAGSSLSLPQIVTTDCDLRWKFKSEGGDLCFGVKRKSDKNPSTPVEEVLTPTRVSFLPLPALIIFLPSRLPATRMCSVGCCPARLASPTYSALTTPSAASGPRLSSTLLSWSVRRRVQVRLAGRNIIHTFSCRAYSG